MKPIATAALAAALILGACDRPRDERTGVRSPIEVNETERGRLRGTAAPSRLGEMEDSELNQLVTSDIKEARHRIMVIGDRLREVHKNSDPNFAPRDSMQGAFCGDLGKVDDQLAQAQELLPKANSGAGRERDDARAKIDYLLKEIKSELDTAQTCAENPGLPR